MTLNRQGRQTAFSLSCNTEATNPWRCHCYPRKEDRMNNIKKERKISPLNLKKKKGSEQNEKRTYPTLPLGKELLEACVICFSGGSLGTGFGCVHMVLVLTMVISEKLK